MSTWDAARLASRRPLPKPRKMMGPVGPEALKRPADGDNWCDAVRELGIDANALSIEHTHSCCGHHVCSCKPYDPIHANPTPLEAILDELDSLGVKTVAALDPKPVEPPSITVNGVETTESEFNRLLQLDGERMSKDPFINGSYARAADAQFSPGTQAYLKYARFRAVQQSGVSGLNSVARGKSE